MRPVGKGPADKKTAGRPTIRDVAAAAGYSIATVSMVLNNRDVSIPKSTRDKVWAAAKRLHYRPNSLAVSLITRRTRVLGLIIPDNRSLYFSSLSLAVEAAARRAGYALIYGNAGNTAKRDLAYLEMFLDRQVDGIALLLSSVNDPKDVGEIMRVIRDSGVPVVAVDRGVPGSGLPTVQMDHHRAGYLAARHLLELGHRRIGCCISPGFITARLERGQGYRDALVEFGVAFDEGLLFQVPYEGRGDEAVFRRIAASGVTGLLAINDAMALDFYRFARGESIRIPGDISVVGSDDNPSADMLSPPLTTIRQPVGQVGEAAVESLLALIEGGEGCDAGPRLRQFQPQLVVRGSTAAPPKREGG